MANCGSASEERLSKHGRVRLGHVEHALALSALVESLQAFPLSIAETIAIVEKHECRSSQHWICPFVMAVIEDQREGGCPGVLRILQRFCEQLPARIVLEDGLEILDDGREGRRTACRPRGVGGDEYS